MAKSKKSNGVKADGPENDFGIATTQREALTEQWQLYRKIRCQLKREEDELRENFGIARNLACSDWGRCLEGLHVTRIHPDRTDKLHLNFEILLDEISRQRYYLMVAFEPMLRRFGHWASEAELMCFEFWNKKLGLVDPETKRSIYIDPPKKLPKTKALGKLPRS
jgi:hypothetical protein